ncbi:MAG TPA: hypothetical protein VE962_08235, partial [Actinomycetota bacterium]|nr:hypothetical protein [Actinomycetota bacterium]
RGDRDREGAWLLLARFGLVLLALLLLWATFELLARYREQFAVSFRLSVGPVILIAVAAVAAGVAFGLGVSLPTRPIEYGWSRVAVLGILPLLLTIVYVAIYAGEYGWLPGAILLRLVANAEAGLIGSGLLLGIAVAAGFGRSARVSTPLAPTVRP